jgi:hypothetical protein
MNPLSTTPSAPITNSPVVVTQPNPINAPVQPVIIPPVITNPAIVNPPVVVVAVQPAANNSATQPVVINTPVVANPPVQVAAMPNTFTIDQFKLRKLIYKKPTTPELPNPLPPAPTEAQFESFLLAHVPGVRSLSMQRGPFDYYSPQRTVVGRLKAVIYRNDNLFGQFGASHVGDVYRGKLIIIFKELSVTPTPPDAQRLVQELVNRSQFCGAALMAVIDEVYSRLFPVDSIKEQIVRLIGRIKLTALETYVMSTHPDSIDPAVLNNWTMASRQYPHVRNAYLAVLGDDLGLEEAAAAKSDQHAHRPMVNEPVALAAIKAMLSLDDIVTSLISEVNREHPLPEDFVTRDKVTFWAYANRSGDLFDGRQYVAIPGIEGRFIWEEMDAARQNQLSVPNFDPDYSAWLGVDTALELLEIEGFIKRR